MDIEDHPDFDSYARDLVARQGRGLAAIVLAAALLFWPFDRLLYGRDPEIVDVFAYWRAALCATSLVGLGAIHWARKRDVDPYWIICALMCVGTVLSAVALAHMGNLDRPFFLTGSFISLMVAPLAFTRVRRIAIVVLIPILFVAAFFRTRPDYLGYEHFVQVAAIFAFSVVASLAFGELIERLFRDNFEKRCAIADHARALEELDRLKNDFFANVSHELRTPLTLILGALRRVDAAPDRTSRAAVVGVAQRNTGRLLVLIDELLELSRFVAGQAEPRRQLVSVANIVASVTANFTSGDAQLVVTGTDAPSLAFVDPRQLRTALFNLLSNAFKFTDPATRRIGVELGVDEQCVTLAVTDNGIGIPTDEQSHVFTRFHQVDATRTRRRGGAGIGLSLVKEIAVAHGGRVELESSPGQGSRFTMFLPRSTAADGTERYARSSLEDPDEFVHAAELARLDGARSAPAPAPTRDATAPYVLVVEDDADLREYVRDVLSVRFAVETASNGVEALAAVRERAPDAVVTDVMMPDASGHDLVRALRAEPAFARIPVLFLTAHTATSARVEAYESGADDFLSKPFQAEELLARIANLLTIRRNEAELAKLNGHLEELVGERTADLRRLAAHLETSQEDERRRIAREIHDETGQMLTALRMELELATRRVDSPRELGEAFARMDEILALAIDATRTLVSDLRPRLLDDLGLGAAAEWYLTRVAERSPMKTTWSVDVAPEAIDAACATAAFRVMQESITNAIRHAKASRIDIALRCVGEVVTLDVCDDGVGFDPSARATTGCGILGMRERIHALGGSLAIEPAQPNGTRVLATLPARAAQVGTAA